MKFILILLALAYFGTSQGVTLPHNLIYKQFTVEKFTFSGDIRYWNNTTQKELTLCFKEGETSHYLIAQGVSMPYEFPDGYYTLTLDENTLQIQTRFGTTYFFAVAGGSVKESEQYAKKNKHIKADLGIAAIYHFQGKADTFKTFEEIKKGYATAYEYFSRQ